jgi:NADH:ubiquinone oxidoreductase subunit E
MDKRMTRYSDIGSLTRMMHKAYWDTLQQQDISKLMDEAYPEKPDWLQEFIINERNNTLEIPPQEVWSISAAWLDSQAKKQEITE